jgi:hypothetical protein
MSALVRTAAIAVIAAASMLAFAAAARAAPPANDSRAAPQPLGALPALVRGTTVGATLEPDEPGAGCAGIKGSVWYSFTAPTTRDLVVAVDAAGDMDAVVELFVRERSQITSVDCAVTDKRGLATLDDSAVAGTDYLIRVAPRDNSVADRFTLRVVVPDEPARPPGDPLPRSGASGRVDRLANPDDAWSTRLVAGRTYRVNLVTEGAGCVRVELFAPGEFGGSPERSLACDDFSVYTPPQSGRYSLRVQAPRGSRASWRYRLAVGRAGRDDSAPGVTLADDHKVSGSLHGGGLDALDLYRFTLDRRADLRLRMRTSANFDVRLLTEGGHRRGTLVGSGDMVRRLHPGRYFVAVSARDGANGRYVLSRLARVITSARTLVDGRHGAAVAPGAAVALALQVRPAVTGPATLVVERYDPLAGWLFHSRFRGHVSGTGMTVPFLPPSVGRWRVTGSYDGTRKSSPSDGGTARFTVVEPLGP